MKTVPIFALSCVLALCYSTIASGQSATFNGNATDLGSNCFQITDDVLWQSSSVWVDSLNVNQPFTFSFEMNFGLKDQTGADGIVFVLHNQGPTALGVSGGELSYGTIDSSLTVEFDNHENANFGDPAFDHIAMQSMGVIDHNALQNVMPPVPTLASSGNVEDGLDHTVVVDWAPATGTFEVYFDCALRITTTLNMSDYFGTDSLVFWGFTGSTGGLSNAQSVCLTQLVNAVPQTTNVATCNGLPVTLTAPNSLTGWTWSPNYMISGTTTQAVTVTPAVDTTYVVSYQSGCITVTDTFTVSVVAAPNADLGPDQSICSGETLVLDATTTGATYLWQDGSTGPTLSVTTGGQYSVDVNLGGCIDSDTLIVTMSNALTVDLGADVTLCSGQSVVLDATTPNATYTWQNNSTQAMLTAATTGQYTVVVAVNGCTGSDTVEVTVEPAPIVDLGTDTLLCPGDSTLLVASTFGANYLWQDGSTGPWLLAYTGGTYAVTVTVAGCESTGSILITDTVLPPVDLGTDTLLCPGDSTLLVASAFGATYLWQDGTSRPWLLAYSAGTYAVEVNVFGCETNGSITIQDAGSLTLDLGADTTVCDDDPVDITLSASASNSSYNWQDGSTNASYNVTQPGTYMVTVSNACQELSDQIVIASESCDSCDVHFPNVFTPNGDGINDYFEVMCAAESASIEIYDRWGALLFSTDRAANDFWAGRNFVGTALEAGVYYYVFDNGTRAEPSTGFVHLMR